MTRPVPRIDLFDVRPEDERAYAFARSAGAIEALLFTSPLPVDARP